MRKTIENVKSVTPKGWKRVGKIATVIGSVAAAAIAFPLTGPALAIAIAVAGVSGVVASLAALKKVTVEDVLQMGVPELRKLLELLNNKNSLTDHEEELARVAKSKLYA